MAEPLTAADVPAAARTLHRRLIEAGWSIAGPRHGSGAWAYSALSETEDGNGKRKRTELVEDVESVLVRARHVDGRALVALWVRRASRKGWSLDLAWRGRHPDEHTPRPITATQLRAYAAAPDHRTALAAAELAGQRRPRIATGGEAA